MKLKFLLAALLSVPVLATADVNPKKGDFFIVFPDIEQQVEEHDLNLTRTYNSLAPEIGWFGSGWGSLFETRLIPMPDGTVAVQENGNGPFNHYRAKDKSDIENSVSLIVEAATQRDNLSPDAAAALREKLAVNEELRVRKVLQFGLQTDLPINAVLHSDCGDFELKRITDGYKRAACDGSNEYFDLQGNLLRREKSDYTVSVNYEGKRPVSIKDTLGQSLNLKWTPEGLLAEASSNDNHHIRYTYNNRKDLVASSNEVDGLSFTYEYDIGHNMIRIGYVDRRNTLIAYLPSSDGIVQSVTERSGDKTEYEYRSDPNDPLRTWTKVTEIAVSGEQFSREFEYQHKMTETGSERLAYFAKSRNGRNREETTFDEKRRITRKVNNDGDVTEYSYHPKNDKLILVLSKDLKTEFHYDAQGNLKRAEDSNGRVIYLDYQSTKKIQHMVEINRMEKTRRELKFKYNADGQPTEITLIGTGKIAVEYDDKGEISKVTSDKGSVMALQVSQVFQSLLSVVKAANPDF